MTHVRYLFYRLTLEAPAIFSAFMGDPNHVPTLSYVPGSAVRGAAAGALGDPGTDEDRQKEFRKLILGGQVRYLNAYPEHEGRRSLPLPLSIRREKNVSNGSNHNLDCWDLSAFHQKPEGAPSHKVEDAWPETQLGGIPDHFATMGEARPVLVQPLIGGRLHNQRDRKKGRAWKDVDKNGKEVPHGAVFSLESIDAEQHFQGVVQIREESEAECDRTATRIRSLLGERILVGRSRRGGYGGMARLEWLSDGDPTREVSGPRLANASIPAEDFFRVLVTSPCIARDFNTGQVNPRALISILEEKLSGCAQVLSHRWSFEVIGGFNRKWRLEIPQVLAVSAGSVFTLKASREVPMNLFREIENDGIGERKAEGYGRLLFLEQRLSGRLQLFLRDRPDPVEGAGEPPEFVKEIEGRILIGEARRLLREKAASFAQSTKKQRGNRPSNSLIGRLRTPLRHRPEKGLAILKSWLDRDDPNGLKSPAMEQLDNCYLKIKDETKSLGEWLRQAIELEKLPAWLEFDRLSESFIVSKESAKNFLLEPSRREELVVELIDHVLGGLAILNKQKEAEASSPDGE